ncbi:hypothetical protein ACINK0_05130 [Deinococcus sp. VB343]|uniref:Uncharacterized protein n=1 Tax=Deinococcus sp. VB142 TaxID=3112952 RepID=A0AAU6PZW7_9DEIO
MKKLPLLVSLIVMLVLVSTWWILTGRAPVARTTEPELASRGDALVGRLNTRLGTMWNPARPAPDWKPPQALRTIARYPVEGGELKAQEGERIQAVHRRSWSTVTTLLPPEVTREVGTFLLSTDGRGGDRGRVKLAPNGLSWQLALDPRDSAPVERLNTLIYQSAFLTALAPSQLQTLPEGYPCPTVLTSAGCVQSGSLMQRYVRTFWSDAMLKDWRRRKVAEQPTQTQAFFAAYPNTFLNVSAARGPEQDFAMSWTAFILGQRPAREDTAAQRKVAFFYSDPQLTALRLKILRRVSSAFPAKS